jgi:hypothetical protein
MLHLSYRDKKVTVQLYSLLMDTVCLFRWIVVDNSDPIACLYLFIEHIHSLIDRPYFILGVGIYATVSNCLLGMIILCEFHQTKNEPLLTYDRIDFIMRNTRKSQEQSSNLQQTLSTKFISNSCM